MSDSIKVLRMNVKRSDDRGYLKESADLHKIEATLILAEQVKRIADLLEGSISDEEGKSIGVWDFSRAS